MRRLWRWGAAAGVLAWAGAVQAAPVPAPASGDARIQELEQEVRALTARVQQLETSKAAAPAGATATISAPGQPTGPAAVPSPGASSASPAPPPAQVAKDDSPSPTSGASAGAPGAPATELAKADTSSEAGVIPAGTPTSAASAYIAGGKPTIQSADGQFSTSIHGVMQLDAADYRQATPGPTSADFRRGGASGDTARARDLNSGTDFRRARLGFDGRVFGAFEYNVLTEFGGTGEEDAGHIQELWVQYSGLRPFHLRIGAFAPFIGLEDANSTNGLPFLERPASSDLARNVAGGDYREAAQLVANTGRWFLSAAVTGRTFGTVNSTASGVSQPYDSQLGAVGRAAIIPFKGKDWLLHVGVHGSWVARPADAGGPDASLSSARYPVEFRIQPELRVDATRLIDTGAIDARHAFTAGAELAAQKGPVYLQAEYESLGIERRDRTLADPHFSGWYVEGSWMLTGEKRAYNYGNYAFDGPAIAHNFNPKAGSWGAWELAARYSRSDLDFHPGAPGRPAPADGVRGGDQSITSVGLNWYLNPVIRFMFDYQFVRVDRLSPNATTFLTPAGAQVGQNYNVVDVRTQFAF